MIRAATLVAIPGRHARTPAPALFLLSLLATAYSVRGSFAEPPAEGLLVEVPAGITTESTGRLRSELLRPLKNFEQGAGRQGGKFTLVCDFNPEGRRADCDDFGASYELAKYLRKLQTDFKGVRTVAYVHGDVRRHSVLAVLACTEIIFSESGRLGPVLAGEPLPDAEQAAYAFITRGRFPPALIRKLYDPALEVVKVGQEFLDANQKPRPRGQPVAGLVPGEPATYTFALAKELGLCQQLPLAKLEDVRGAYRLPRASLARSLERTVWRRVVLDGPVNGELVEQTIRRVKQALRDRPNVLLLEIRCAGGSSEKAHELGLYLASLNERKEHPVETIAYVTNKARNLAAFLAFGCNKIVMQRDDAGDAREPDDGDDSPGGEARLGGFALFITRHPTVDPLRREIDKGGPGRRNDLEQRLQDATGVLETTLKEQLSEVASKQNYPAAIVAGMFSRDLRIHLVERAKGAAGGQALLTEDEFKADQQGERLWREVKLVKPWEGQPRFDKRYLTLTARQAKELDLARDVVKDLDELYEHERVKPADVKTIEADWLDGLADFLREPWTSVILVMVGITCLILELKMPGVGLPGVIAAICFVLFFWAHSQLHGQITWLAILLFVLGLVLIGLEIFVLPGLGVCGISGVLLVLASLGLVAYGHWPRTSEEWVGFGNKIGPFGVSLLGALCLVFLVVRYLPHIPVLNRLMLRNAEDDEDQAREAEDPLHAERQALLGAIGVAATPLRPAGKTQFGDSFIDVVAEGGYVLPGTRVQVIEVEGNRVVVKEV
jgi:membrane-bound ClpP family serine protease